MKIKTKRLILKSIENELEIEKLGNLLANYRLTKQAGLLLPADDTRKAAIKMLVINNHLLLVTLPKTGQVIGIIMLSPYYGAEGKRLTQQYELGYLLATAEQNKGYMTEALQKMIAILPVNTILHATVLPQNKASQHVLRKCAFTPDKNNHWYLRKLAI